MFGDAKNVTSGSAKQSFTQRDSTHTDRRKNIRDGSAIYHLRIRKTGENSWV